MLITHSAKGWGMLASATLLLVAFWLSLAIGQTEMAWSSVFNALTAYQPGNIDHLIVRTERFSRTIIAALVGSSLAVAGALMQTLTRNALAAPSVLGINAGAMLLLVVASTWWGLTSPFALVWVAFLGAGGAAFLVYLLGRSPGRGLSSVRVVLAGVAMTALFVSLAQGVLIAHQDQFESLLFWLAGSVAGRELSAVTPLLPLFGAALLLCALLCRSLNLLALDDEVATGLGQHTGTIKLLTGSAVIVLAGGAVAIAGMIGFVGLIVPHMVRGIFGRDHHWVLPGCALSGASLLMLADTGARLLIPPQEVPVGIMTALLGTPFFLYLARRRSLGL